MLNRNYMLPLMVILIFLTVGMVSANQNGTDEISVDEEIPYQEISEAPIAEEIESIADENVTVSQETTKIEAKDVKTYYMEKSDLVAYLKDADNRPISNKKVSIFIDNKNYDKLTDKAGMVILKLNLKPGKYTAKFDFMGDDRYAPSSAKAIVKVNKADLQITTKNFKTYFESGFYFKAKVINKVTKKPVEGVKLAFMVYKNNKYKKACWATTNSKGIAKLKKNLKVGHYKVVTFIKKSKYLKAKKSKAKLTIKQTAEMGCSSVFLQVSKYESVAGFRRDATNEKLLHIVKYKLEGKSAIKQFKTDSYFFHLVTTADGWMFATGGIDNPDINAAIERIAGKIVKSGKIKQSYLGAIQDYERRLSLGHFSIKAPNGNYGAVWSSGIWTGKLNPGEYIDVPNLQSYFRYGNWKGLSKNPVKAGMKVAATDSYGVNRRDITIFHWKSTTKEGKTSSYLKVFAANDNGNMVGRSTGYLIDDISFKGKFYSKYDLPNPPSRLCLGVHKFGSIDKLVKTQTKVKAYKLTKMRNESRMLKITVKNKKTKEPIKNLKLRLKIGKKVYAVKTNSKGIAKFNPKFLKAGTHKVKIYSANFKYHVSATSTIKIT